MATKTHIYNYKANAGRLCSHYSKFIRHTFGLKHTLSRNNLTWYAILFLYYRLSIGAVAIHIDRAEINVDTDVLGTLYYVFSK